MLVASKSKNYEIEDVLSEHIENILEALFLNNRTIQFITVVNCAIFLMWRFVDLKFMEKHFISSPKNRKNGIWWSEFLSSFSHIELHHLAGNLAALTLFGPPSVSYLGNIRFFIFVTFSSVLGSLLEITLSDSSFVPDRVKKAKSLGFSGINSALFVVFFHRSPQTKLLSSNQVLTVKDALYSAIISDLIGFVLDSLEVLESPIAHLVHLAGYASGFFLIYALKFQNRLVRLLSSQLSLRTQSWKLLLAGIGIGYFLSILVNDDRIKLTDSLWVYISQFLQF